MEKPWLSHYEPQVPPTLTYPPVPLSQTLTDSATKYPDNIALHLVLKYMGPASIGGKLTYRELADRGRPLCGRAACAGRAQGRPGGPHAAQSPQFVIAFYGILKLGAIVVNTNPQYTSREIEHQFADAGAETVILLSPFYARLAGGAGAHRRQAGDRDRPVRLRGGAGAGRGGGAACAKTA